MVKTSRKRYTREFKISVLRELEGGKNLAQVSRENNLHPTVIIRWRQEYEKNPDTAFSGNGNTYKEAARIGDLERLVGQLYAENNFLKKVLASLEKRGLEEKVRSKAE
jgi:transposase